MQGFTFYEGPSQIDGEPVAAIAVGLKSGSVNTKTGPLVQAYFLHPDLSPQEAVRSGADHRICGTCRHRGRVVETEGGLKNVERSCYVTLFQGPRVVYEGYRRGLYPAVAPEHAGHILTGRMVRLGAYGDPACVPDDVLDTVMAHTCAHTGYTHAWRERPGLARWTMASCDTEVEREQAKRRGFRTFRVRGRDDPLMAGEGHCPASAEMGKVTTCNACRICDGTRTDRKVDITILAHGAGAGHFLRSVQEL